jgi:hypothetical protein
MTPTGRWAEFTRFAREELRHLVTLKPSDRLWPMPFAAALATGLPLLVGAFFNHMNYGLVSSLGGLVFLYLPATALHHRMVTLMACAFAMTACYTLGVISHFFPLLMMPVLIFIAILISMVCRFYALGPPSSLFFIMAAAIGAYTPLQVLQVPLMVGLISMGTLLAFLIAFFYSIYTLRFQAPQPAPPLLRATFDFVVFDSVIIGLFVGISLALAQVLQLQKSYWVPVSCLAVIQGASLRAVWTKQLHRVLGTGAGLLVAWGLLLLPLDKWTISLTVMVLTFVIEMAVVRHYAFAVIFITPLTILLVEAATLGQTPPAPLIEARFLDTVLGCVVGLAGGICLHSPRFRDLVGGPMRRLIPSRFVQ